MMKRWILLVILSFLGMLLAACGRQAGPSDTFTEEEVVEALVGIAADLATVNDPMAGEALLAALQVPLNSPGCPELENMFELITFAGKADLTTLSGSGGTLLARGSYTYDPDADACTLVSDTDDLVLSYPYQTSGGSVADAELRVDWDVDSDTLEVADPAGDLHEVPTAMNAVLNVAGQGVADIDVALAWYNAPECGTDEGVLEPTLVSASGSLSSLSLTDIGYSVSDDSLKVQGSVATEDISVDLDLDVSGELTRTNCFIDTFAADTGSFSFGVASSVNGDSSVRLSTSLSDVVFEDFDVSIDDTMLGMVQGISSVILSDGTLQIDGTLAATFEGSLDDDNGNGVSGENVMISFTGGGETDLESFLLDNDFGSALP